MREEQNGDECPERSSSVLELNLAPLRSLCDADSPDEIVRGGTFASAKTK